MVTAQRGEGSKVTRNVSMFRGIQQTLIQESDTRDDSCENILPLKKETSPSTEREEEIALHPPQLSISRSKRTVRPPRRLLEEISTVSPCYCGSCTELFREPVGLYAFFTDSHVWQLKISER